MKPIIKTKLIKALESGDYLLNLRDEDAPLCEILPDGRHRFSPAGVLCDLAPKEVADWRLTIGRFAMLWKRGSAAWYHSTPGSVDRWAGIKWYGPPINGHRTLSATIKAIKEL